MSTITKEFITAEQFAFLSEAFCSYSTIAAADRLGVLSQLEKGPATQSTLARDCAISERGAKWLLASLATLGLAASDGQGTYHTSLPNLASMSWLIKMWDGLDTVIREGRSIAEGNTATGSGNFYPEVTPILGRGFAEAADQVASHLGYFGTRALDLGAGAAPWSIAVARHNPDCHVTAVDLPSVIKVTQRVTEAEGVASQYTYLGGDLFVSNLGNNTYDLALAGNLCHLFDENANRNLLMRLYHAIAPGGKVAIVDILPNEEMTGPRGAILYGLGLLLRTSLGEAYPFSAYASWLEEAGFDSVECFHLPSSLPLSLITARKPSK